MSHRHPFALSLSKGLHSCSAPEGEGSDRLSPNGKRRTARKLCRDADPKGLQAWARANGVTGLMIPRDIRILDALPVLGTGKLDYVAMTALAAWDSPDA